MEVGHGNGLGASSLQIGRSRLDDNAMHPCWRCNDEMSFTLTLTAMRECRDYLRTAPLENFAPRAPYAAKREVLGRASRWLDQPDGARCAYLLAGGDLTTWLGRAPLRLHGRFKIMA